MLKLKLSKETEIFRDSFREWLLKNPPPIEKKDTSLDTFIKEGREWQAKLAKDNWVAVHWPKEFGGRGLTLVEEAIIQEELARANSPQLLGLFGLTMAGPILIQYGTLSQKSRFLSNILNCNEIWCQGFSEPDAGSDLSALKTKAKKDSSGSGYYVTGNKVWTSFAQIADWCFLLCRMDDEQQAYSVNSNASYSNFSYLLVDMKSPGITVRPLKQISGDSEFNEVFFDNVFVPMNCLVGNEGEGWKIAISTLMYERVILTFARQLQSEVLITKLLNIKRGISSKIKRGRESLFERELADEILALSAVRSLSYEHLLQYNKNSVPGPEGSLDKLGWTNSFQSLAKLATKNNLTSNFDNKNKLVSKSRVLNSILNEEENPDIHRYLYSRGRSIAAGTSEIQRNIIAERILGLKKARR